MQRFRIGILISLLACIFHASVQAGPPRTSLPDLAKGYDWKAVARKAGLGDREIAQLGKDKILVTNEPYLQVFTPYLHSDIPLFITSDSMLNGFHVLYEESLLRLEQANARRLRGILKFMWKNLPTADKVFRGKRERVADAKMRAAVIVATAMRLLGDEPDHMEPTIAALVQGEVKRIEAAKGQHKPAWLGPPDPGFMALDYSRYLPRGFYTKHARARTLFSSGKLVAVDSLPREEGRRTNHDPATGELCHLRAPRKGFCSSAGP